MTVVARLFPDRVSVGKPRHYPGIGLFPSWGAGRWVYAIGYENGVAKIGTARNPRSRIRALANHASGAVAWAHLFGRWGDAEATWIERRACHLAAKSASAVHGFEWFNGVDRAAALTAVRSAAAELRAMDRSNIMRKWPTQRPALAA